MTIHVIVQTGVMSQVREILLYLKWLNNAGSYPALLSHFKYNKISRTWLITPVWTIT
jgi:hypothetical protein